MFNGGMGNMNMNAMMQKVQKLQKQMTKMQEEIKQREVEVSAGGGAVKVVMNGDKKLISLTLDKSAVDPEDVEMLQDLISAAINQCMDKVDDMMKTEMSKITGGLGLPPGMF